MTTSRSAILIKLHSSLQPDTTMKLPSMVSVLALLFLNVAHAADAPAPAVGGLAPNFRLQDQSGQWRTLDEYRGQWLALYFYPKDGTPGCTTQACGFRDNIFAFREIGAVIVGISVDDVASHKKFQEEHGLPFTILADSNKEVTKSYGVLKKFMGMEMAQRDTFLIDPAGKIAKHYVNVDPKGHSQIVLADIKALQGKK